MITVTPRFSKFVVAQSHVTRFYFGKAVESVVNNKRNCEKAVMRCFRQKYRVTYKILYDMMIFDSRDPLNSKIEMYLGEIGYEEFLANLVESLDNHWYSPYLDMVAFGYLKDIERTWYQWRFKVRIDNDLDLHKFKKAVALSYMARYSLAK
jgi:hypothetical protein